MRLALFDLDNTLLPLDSDYEWGSFLERIGAVDAQAHRLENDRFYREYVAGTMDIREFLWTSSSRRWPLTVRPCVPGSRHRAGGCADLPRLGVLVHLGDQVPAGFERFRAPDRAGGHQRRRPLSGAPALAPLCRPRLPDSTARNLAAKE